MFCKYFNNAESDSKDWIFGLSGKPSPGAEIDCQEYNNCLMVSFETGSSNKINSIFSAGSSTKIRLFEVLPIPDKANLRNDGERPNPTASQLSFEFLLNSIEVIIFFDALSKGTSTEKCGFRSAYIGSLPL